MLNVPSDNGLVFIGRKGNMTDAQWSMIKSKIEIALEAISMTLENDYGYICSMGYWDDINYKEVEENEY